MSDIICARCREPWDSTGGIQHTHSDLTEKQYTLLLEGRGCSCCRGDVNNYADIEITDEMKAEFIEAWQKSVEHLSEGEPDLMYYSFEKQPKPPVDAEQYESAW